MSDEEALDFVILSQGDYMSDIKIFSVLAHALVVARKKHPVFADGAVDGWDVIEDELIELHNAIHHETEQRQFEEAIDVAVTAIRFALGEHKKQPEQEETEE